MISQVESFLYPDKQMTLEEGRMIHRPKRYVSTHHNNDEDNSLKNHNQSNTISILFEQQLLFFFHFFFFSKQRNYIVNWITMIIWQLILNLVWHKVNGSR